MIINPLDLIEHDEEQENNYFQNYEQLERNLIIDKVSIENLKNVDYKVMEVISQKIYPSSSSQF